MHHVTFFTHFHSGDLHVSREFIRKIMSKVSQIDNNILFSYAHVNDPNLLSDIPGLRYERLSDTDQFENLQVRRNTTYVNTWYGQQHFKYMNPYGMTLDCLYTAFDDSCKTAWGFSLADINSDPASFIPTIDYFQFKIQPTQEWIHQNPHKKIFISNGQALSGQANNFPMTPIITDLAGRHKEKIFILSNVEGSYNLPRNVIYSKDIIKKPYGSDLNENSFLASHCDLIVGRASGSFSYAWTQQNLLQRKCKFLAFCIPGVITKPPYQFWTHSLFHDKIKYSAEIFESTATEHREVLSIIESHL